MGDEAHPGHGLLFLLYLYKPWRIRSGPFILSNQLVSGRPLLGKRLRRLYFSLWICDLAAIRPPRAAHAGGSEVPYYALSCLDGELVSDRPVAQDPGKKSPLMYLLPA